MTKTQTQQPTPAEIDAAPQSVKSFARKTNKQLATARPTVTLPPETAPAGSLTADETDSLAADSTASEDPARRDGAAQARWRSYGNYCP